MTSTCVKLFMTCIACVISVVSVYVLVMDASHQQNILSVTRPELNATEVYNTIKSSYPSSVVLLNGSEVVKLPVGLYEIMPWTEFNATEAAPAGNMELAYHKLQNRINMQCYDRIRLGHWGDGGWDMCLAGIYKPKMTDCLVYSFGINNDWSFDDAITKMFNCTLRAFDPTITNGGQSMRGKNIHFYPVGLFGENTKIKLRRESPVKTLNTLRKEFHDDTKVIDYLKIDIEGSEWSALKAMYHEGFLQQYVKQIGIEFHDYKMNHTDMILTVNRLESLGFRKWMNNWNMHCVKINKMSLHATHCYEVYFVNLNLLK